MLILSRHSKSCLVLFFFEDVFAIERLANPLFILKQVKIIKNVTSMKALY